MSASVVKLLPPVAYLAFVAGLSLLCVNLSRDVGTQMAALVTPYVAGAGDRPPTLVERRQMAALAAVEPSEPEIVAADLEVPSVLEVPGIPARVLAEQLDLAERVDRAERVDLAEQEDLAERVDLVSLEPRAKRPAGPRLRVSRAPPTRVAAADVFGRSFGVMLVAAR